MKIDNKFYLVTEQATTIFSKFSYASGSWREMGDARLASTPEIVTKGKARLRIFNAFNASYCEVYWLDNNKSLMHIDSLQDCNLDIVIDKKAFYVSITFYFDSDVTYTWKDITYEIANELTPHYTSLKKQYKKESNQIFFRENLGGRIVLFGKDYDLINSKSIEDRLVFDIYQDGKKYVTTEFNKTDCKFDHARKSVELNLEPNDLYTKVLSKYQNTYDIIKLAPKVDRITLTKRCIIQIYIRGENVVSSYAGGTYWETEVIEPIDDSLELVNKYHFAYGPVIREINLTDFNYPINGVFACIKGTNIWNCVSSVKEINGKKQELYCSIVFTKVYSKGANGQAEGRLMSTGTTSRVTDGNGKLLYDIYTIGIFDDRDGKGHQLYVSDYMYANDRDFEIQKGNGFYPMTAIAQTDPSVPPSPSPNKFNLGECIIEYRTFGRLLCDVNSIKDGDEDIETFDLPSDDFIVERANYKKCIGLTGFDYDNAIVKIIQKAADRTEPTAYGANDFGMYFSAPYSTGSDKNVLPLSRNAWANTSLWVSFETSSYPETNLYEKWCAKHYKQFTLKDCYHIGNVIKSLLAKIDSRIKHDITSEYSQFLYGNTGASSYYLHNCQLYITQKTNLLKGEYDQAAQKAEITLEQIMNMLRDCFRCYWYIDEQNRFRIEHIYYFINGLSYSQKSIQYDLTKIQDKFNKKNILYCQKEISYEKSDLNSRYEFNWMDNVTDSMGNLTVDILNEYIPNNSTEDINIEQFTTDIDYMIFMPSDFSNDGFALLAAKNNVVPISQAMILRDEKQFERSTVLTPQNWVVSWNNLIFHYSFDMPGNLIETNQLPYETLRAANTKMFIQHQIQFQNVKKDPELYKLIKTQFGNGVIKEVSINIDTKMASVLLEYNKIDTST